MKKKGLRSKLYVAVFKELLKWQQVLQTEKDTAMGTTEEVFIDNADKTRSY